MKVSARRLLSKLERHGVRFELEDGWDSAAIDPFDGSSDFCGVLLHHTAGVDSRRWIAYTNPYAPVRACHFLVQRDGTVVVMSGSGAYHAGKGGPWRFASGGRNVVPVDAGNRHLYGIEIESLGGTGRIDGSREGMSVEQVIATALLSAALLDAMRLGPGSRPVSRVIRHRDWTSRKVDVRQDLEWWHAVIGIARRNNGNVAKSGVEIRRFVAAHPKGRIR